MYRLGILHTDMLREKIFHLGVMVADVPGNLCHVLELILAVRTLLPVVSQQFKQPGLVVTVGVVTVETFLPLQIILSTQAALLLGPVLFLLFLLVILVILLLLFLLFLLFLLVIFVFIVIIVIIIILLVLVLVLPLSGLGFFTSTISLDLIFSRRTEVS